MIFPEALQIIEKFQEAINDQIVRADDVFAPDEYYLAVSAVLPMLRCMNCLSGWISGNTDGDFVPRCENETNFRPSLQQDVEELPFG